MPWKKGESGSPGGRTKGIARKVRELSNDFNDYLILLDTWARDENVSRKDRIICIKELLDRGAGKAQQTQDISIETPEPIVFVPIDNK